MTVISSFSTTGAIPTFRAAESTGATSPLQQVQGPDTGFAAIMKDYIGTAAETVKQGEAAAVAGIEGMLPVQTVVNQVLAAERAVQAAIAVRDKLVGSYLEISRMQI